MTAANLGGRVPANGAPIDRDEVRKFFATLQARLAMRGYAVHELSSGGYLISRWNLTKHAPDLTALGQFATEVGA